MASGRHQGAVAARRHHDLGDIKIAARITADPVWGEEISGSTGISAAAPARPKPAAAVENADAAAGVVCSGGRRTGPSARMKAQLGHVDAFLGIDKDLAWPGYI